MRDRRVVVLISRGTFSAATNFATELEQEADVTFVGEPTGGSPNLYGDPAGETLPASGLNAHGVTAADHFAGRDPVLAAARGR